MKSLAVEVLVYNNFEVEDGENDFSISSFLSYLKKFDLKPSDRCKDWEKYDCLLDYDSDAFYDLDDYEDDDDDDEDENTKTLPEKDEDEDEDNDEVPERVLALAAALKSEVEDEIGDCLPWMDNCWNNHSFSYDLTRRPAGIKEENCEVNYDAKTYKDLLTYESIDDDDDDFDFEGEEED